MMTFISAVFVGFAIGFIARAVKSGDDRLDGVLYGVLTKKAPPSGGA